MRPYQVSNNNRTFSCIACSPIFLQFYTRSTSYHWWHAVCSRALFEESAGCRLPKPVLRRNSMNKTLIATAIALAFGVSCPVLANPVNTNNGAVSGGAGGTSATEPGSSGGDGSVSQSATAESTQKKNSGAQANENST